MRILLWSEPILSRHFSEDLRIGSSTNASDIRDFWRLSQWDQMHAEVFQHFLLKSHLLAALLGLCPFVCKDTESLSFQALRPMVVRN